MTDVQSGQTAPFALPVRVYWEDTDAGGVVYYANYLRFLERARSDWLRELGLDQERMRTTENAQLVVRSVHCEYLKPARLDDELLVTAAVSAIGKASFSFSQTVEKKREILLTAEVKAACLDAKTLRARRFPASLVKALAPLV